MGGFAMDESAVDCQAAPQKEHAIHGWATNKTTNLLRLHRW